MSQQNVDAFKRGVAAANRRDVAALLEELDPEVEWHAVLPMLGGDAVYHGHEGVREFLREIWGTFAVSRLEFPEIRDLGDQVVAVGRICGRGKGSGAETDMPFGYVVEYKQGKAVRVRAYRDPNEALVAVGLSE
jgi:ketosteroid isomerase-like protein